MATRAPIPYFRVAACSGWVTAIVVGFALFGHASPASVILAGAAAIVPPCVFLGLWNDGPPSTVAELLRATEERR